MRGKLVVTGLRNDDEGSMIAVTLVECDLFIQIMLKHPLMSVIVKGRMWKERRGVKIGHARLP
jgi:hypothetical protein